MHDIINYLKGAVNRVVGSGIESCYVVHDGAIYARCNGLQAGIEWPDSSSFTVPADALDAALARMKDVREMMIEDNAIIIKSGRIKSTIKRVHLPVPGIPEFPEQWTRSPPGLGAALDIAKDFVGDRVWTQGIRLMAGRVTAFSGKAGIDIEVPELNLPRPYLITQETAKFLVAQGDPDELAGERNAIGFRWLDGRWVRAQLLADEMPEDMIQRIFDNAGEETPVAVDQEWRESLADAAALSDGVVGLNASGLQGIKEAITTDVDLGADVDISHQSYWDSKLLGFVISRCSAWNPSAYPEPALFKGPGFRGVIAGVKR